jgi:hypothetical protein
MTSFEKAAQEAQKIAQRSVDQVHADKRAASLTPVNTDQWKKNAETFNKTIDR